MDASKLKIIGVSGTNGSGKDTLGHILAKYHNYLFISVTDLLRDECNKRGLNIERENLRKISAEWRAEYGLGVLIDRAINVYNDTKKQYDGLIVSSLRNPGEADRVHDLGGLVVWLDADSRIRYKRISTGLDKLRSNRASEDNKTFEQFINEENAEMYSSREDKTVLDMAAVREKADIFLLNNLGREQLKAQVDKALGGYS